MKGKVRLLLIITISLHLLLAAPAVYAMDSVHITTAQELATQAQVDRNKENHPILVAYEGDTVKLVDWPDIDDIYNRDWGGLIGLYDPFADDMSQIAYPENKYSYAVSGEGNSIFRIFLEQSSAHIFYYEYTYVYDVQGGTVLPLNIGRKSTYQAYVDIRFFENNTIGLLAADGNVKLLYPDGKTVTNLNYAMPTGADSTKRYFVVDLQYNPSSKEYILIYANGIDDSPYSNSAGFYGELAAVIYDAEGNAGQYINLSGLYCSYSQSPTNMGTQTHLQFLDSYIADGNYYIHGDYGIYSVRRYDLEDLVRKSTGYEDGSGLSFYDSIPVSIVIDLTEKSYRPITEQEFYRSKPDADTEFLPFVIESAGGRYSIISLNGEILLELPAGYSTAIYTRGRQEDSGYILFAYSQE